MEQRTRARLSYTADVVVESKERGTLHGIVRDVGMESIYVYMDPFFEPGDKVQLNIIIDGAESRLSIAAAATVVRVDNDGMALKFAKPIEWWPVFSLFPFHQLSGGQHGKSHS